MIIVHLYDAIERGFMQSTVWTTQQCIGRGSYLIPKWFWVQILTWGPFYVHPIPQIMNLHISLCRELGGDLNSLSWTSNLYIPIVHMLNVWIIFKPNMMLISNKVYLTENVLMKYLANVVFMHLYCPDFGSLALSSGHEALTTLEKLIWLRVNGEIIKLLRVWCENETGTKTCSRSFSEDVRSKC